MDDPRIQDITLTTYRWPRQPPISNGRFTYTHSTLCVVEVHTDIGVTGVGVAADPGIIGGERILEATVETLKPLLLYRSALENDDLWNVMWAPKLIGRRGLTTRAISAIDIALWDIRGKLTQQPLWQLLGGSPKELDYYVAGGYYQPGKTTADLITEVQKAVTAGARAVKLKVGRLSLQEDVSRIAAVRGEFGDALRILVDANGAYRFHEAVQLAHRLEPLDIFWLEEPVHADDYNNLARLRTKTIIPIAAGENEYTLYGFRDLITRECVDILNADAQVLGGITEFRKVVALAEAHDVSVAPHGNQDLHAHLISATRSGLILEYYPSEIEVLWHRFHTSELIPKKGTVRAGTAPGVGITLDRAQLAEHLVR